ncbi:MAG TPA: tetratricopeptide repeat protein [Candidatus Tumulicola sp.]|nr:tetratricopeptide repeat protein [Candidatus Tumulicola sp.]
MGFKSITCLSCKRDIQVPTDIADPNCPYCGAAQSDGSSTPISTLATLLGLAGTALAAGNPKEALDYYNRALEMDPKNSEAWFGKGKAAGWQSTLSGIRLPEMLVDFSHAIATAREPRKPEMIALAADEVNRLAATLYKLARTHMIESVRLQTSWSQYLVQVSQLLAALQKAGEWMPSNRTVWENINHLCKDNIEGIVYSDFSRKPEGLDAGARI